MSDFMAVGRNNAGEGAILGPGGDNFKDLDAETTMPSTAQVVNEVSTTAECE